MSPPPRPSTNNQLTTLHRTGGIAARLSMLLPLVAGALLLVQAWLLARVLYGAVVAHQPLVALTLPIAGVLALIVIRAGLVMVAEILAAEASERIKLSLRDRLFGAMLAHQPVWTADHASGALSTLVLEQVDALDGYFARYAPAMVQAAVLPLAFAVVILPFDWMVGLIFLVSAPLIPVFMMLAGWGAEAASKAQARSLARLTGRFADRLRGLVTLKLFGREAAETDAIFAASEELRVRTMKVMRIAFLSSAVLEFFAALGVAGVALYCGLSLLGLIHLRTVPLTLETALFCLLMAPEVYQPLRLLAAHYHDRAAAKAALTEIEATLGEEIAVPAPLPLEGRGRGWGLFPPAARERNPHPAAATLPSRGRAAVAPSRPYLPSPLVGEGARRADEGWAAGAALQVANLTVSTLAGIAIVENTDFTVPAGSHIAILGPSGIGKSTLVEALAGLRDFEGTVSLDGAELLSLPPTALRDRVGFIGQRPRLFAGSIADNIRFGRPGACDTALRAAAQRALVTRFADALPLGLDTPVGEDGLGLSGGEAQRIALARVYLRDPGLILLDEPTAHLDAATEDEVLDQLLVFARGRTLVVATHSAAVAARMDRVYRLAGGTLVEAPRPHVVRPSLKGAA